MLGIPVRVLRYKPEWTTLVSAILYVLAFPPWNQSYLIWICLIPWFESLSRKRTAWEAIREGAWMSFWVTIFAFYWVGTTLQHFGELSWAIAGPLFLLFAVFHQVQFLVLAPIYRQIHRAQVSPQPLSAWMRIALSSSFSFFYAGADSFLPKIFKDTLGHAFWASPTLRQAADLAGAAGLTFVITLVNDALFSYYRRVRIRREVSLWPAIQQSLPQGGLALSLVAALLIYGNYRSAEIARWMSHPLETLNFGVIQANIGDFDKLASENGVAHAADSVIDQYIELSQTALKTSPQPDFLVWPETAYPSTFRTPQTGNELRRDQRIEEFSRASHTPLFFGGYDFYRSKDYNVMFFLYPEKNSELDLPTQDLAIYRKNVLLMFGEYIPGADSIPAIKQSFPQVGNFGRGPGPSLVPLFSKKPKVMASPIICYEALFPDYVLDAARMGSQLIVNITNDSWFGPTAEPELHFALTTMRSVEARLPQLRATNTGISAVVLPDGTVSQSTAIFSATALNATVPIYTPHFSLMKAWGDWFAKLALVLGVVGLLACRKRFGLIDPSIS